MNTDVLIKPESQGHSKRAQWVLCCSSFIFSVFPIYRNFIIEPIKIPRLKQIAGGHAAPWIVSDLQQMYFIFLTCFVSVTLQVIKLVSGLKVMKFSLLQFTFFSLVFLCFFFPSIAFFLCKSKYFFFLIDEQMLCLFLSARYHYDVEHHIILS